MSFLKVHGISVLYYINKSKGPDLSREKKTTKYMKKIDFYPLLSKLPILSTLVALCFTLQSFAAPKLWTGATSNVWTTGTNWSPGGIPVAGDVVTFNTSTGNITAVPTISLGGLIINGNTTLVSSGNRTLTITSSLTVANGVTLTLSDLTVDLSSTATGTISGTGSINLIGTARPFTVNGDLTIDPNAFIISTGVTSSFTLSATGILRIGSTAGITITGATGAIRVTGARTYAAGADYVYNGTAAQVTGLGLTQNTPGTLTINNSAGVTLSAATTVTGLLAMSNGTLDMANTNLTVGSLTGSGNLTHASGTAGNRTLTIGSDNSSPVAYSGIISNGTATTTALTKSGTGTLILSGTNTYTGATAIGAGTLRLGSATTLSTSSAVTVTGTLDLNGFNETVGSFAGTGTVTSSVAGTPNLTVGADNSSSTFSGIIQNGSGTTSLTKSGSGTFVISGNNTYTGATTIGAGTLRLGSATTLTSGTAVTVTGTLDLNNFNGTIGSLAGAGTVTSSVSGNPVLTLGGDNSSTTFSGVIQNGSATTVGITKSGSGVFILSGNNIYTGATTISAGTLRLGSAAALATNTAVTVTGTLDLNGFTVTIGSLAGAGIVTSSVAGTPLLTIGAANTNTTFSGVIQNGSGITSISKSGTGILIVSGTNTYTGTTTVSAGTLRLGSATSLADASAVTVTGTLDLNNFNETLGSLAGAGTVTSSVAGNPVLAVGNDNTSTSFSGIIQNGAATSVGITKNGSGTLTMSGANTFTGNLTVSAGIVQLASADRFANTMPLVMNGGTFRTGATSGFGDQMGTLDLNANSTIAFGTSAHTISFAASNLVGWTAATKLTITGWSGTYNRTAGAAARLFVGTNASGLTDAQLAQIQFFNGATYFPAAILSTGEVVGADNSITTGTVPNSTYAEGASGIIIPFTYATTSAFSGATFTAQLSNASGSFAAPTALQSVASDGTGSQSISITIPSGTTPGTGYRIRVVSNAPAVSGSANTVDFAVLNTLDLAGITPATPTFGGYSVRKLSSAYAGFALELRRSSDGACGNVAFSASNVIDATSIVTVTTAGGSLSVGNTLPLSTFYSGTSCYVKTWYDQSGFGKDATQSNTAKQPRLVNNGVFETVNGKLSVYFQGVANNAQYLATVPYTAYNTAATFNAVAKVNTNSTYNAFVTKTSSNEPAPIDFYYVTGTGNCTIVRGNGTGAGDVFSSSSTIAFDPTYPLAVWTYQGDATYAKSYYNNMVVINDNTACPAFGDNGRPVVIGSRDDQLTSLDGYISEALSIPSISAAELSALHANQMPFFNFFPAITVSTATGTIEACFGTASADPKVQQFTVQGSYLDANVVLTAPTGFELSTTIGGVYSAALNLSKGSFNTVPTTTIYVRSSASAAVGPLSGNVTITSTNATSQTVAVSGTVSAPLVYTYNADDNFRVPPGVTFISVELWGAGGGGSTSATGKGGGGGGAYTKANLTVTPGSLIPVTVGTGGGAGVAGENSSFSGIIANGGGSSTTNAGGFGGAATAIGGSVTTSFAGGAGGAALAAGANRAGGGGGGSALSTAVGTAGTAGGTSTFVTTAGGAGTGAGGVGAAADGSPAAATGNPPGGGGGGGGNTGGASQAGATGRIVVTIPAPILSYSGAPFCKSVTSAPVTLTGLTGGTFSATPAGLTIDATTGTINPSTSTVGTYTVNYSTFCTANIASVSVTIKTVPATPTIAGTTAYTAGGNLSLTASSSTGGVTFTWTPPVTATGLSSLTGNPLTKTGVQNTEAGDYTVIATLNGCNSTSSAITTVTVAPLISTTGTLVAVPTTYGAPSSNTTFTVSGQSITAATGITVTAPAGYEVSTSAGSGFATSINVGGPGTINSTTIYVRLAATTNVGSYSGNVVLSSTGATNVNKATVNSTVSTRALTITADVVNKIYGTLITGGTGSIAFTSTGLQNGQTIGSVTIGYGTGAAANAAVATYTNSVTASAATGGTFTPGNYTITYTQANIVVGAKALTLSSPAVTTKAYNGTTTATITGTLVGVIAPDAVTLVGTGTFASANAGTGIAVTSTSTLGGAQASNYILTQPTGLTGTITAKALTVTSPAVTTKVYDGSATAVITGTLSGIIAPDAVTLSGTGTFASANVGTGILVTSTSTLGGANAANYSLTQPTGLTGTITAKPLTIAGAVASNKVYDRTTVATVTGTLTGVVSPDVVTFSGTGTFASANVGTGIVVTSTSTLGGANAGNYTLTQPTGLTANITAKALTISGLTGVDKVYDGNTTATTSGTAALVGVISPDAVTLGGTPVRNFADANVGTGKAIAITGYTIGGANAGNYTLAQPTGLAANITSKTLSISGLTGVSKAYDGTVTATSSGTAALVGVVSPDVVTLGGTPVRNFIDKNVGTGKAITITGYTLGGAQAGNYVLTQPTGLTANITAKALSVTSPAVTTKAYDGTTTATLTGTLSGIVSPDVVNFVGTGTFASANAGSGISVTSTSSLSGADAGNYTLTQPTGLTGTISGKVLTINSPSVTTKVYDGTTAAVITGTLFGIVAPDVVTLSGTGTFASANVGSGISVTSTSTLGGANAGNYSLAQPSGLTGNITAKALTITADVVNKTYGTLITGAAGSTAFTSIGLVGAQTVGSVTVAYGSGSEASAAVGTYTNSVTPSAATGGTFAASNYNITYAAGNIVVGAKALTITANSTSKCVGSTLNFAGTEFSASGLVNSDAVTSVTLTSTGSGVGATVAGSPYSIVPSAAIGTGLNNYSIAYVDGVLTVNATTSITDHPIASTICNGSNTTFSVTAVGASLTYQWREYGANIPNGGVFSGVTTSTLTITGATSSQDNKYYSVYVQGSCGSAVISNDALLTVKQSPVINSHPGSTSACNGGTVNYVVIATGYGLNYQWKANGSNIVDNATYAGTNTSTLTLSNVNAGLSGTSYTVEVSNGCGTDATSNSATFNIIPTVTPTISISTVSPTTVCTGTSVTYTAAISNGGGTPAYQWKINGGNVGTNSSSFTTSTLINGDQVTSVLTSNSQCVTSSTATSNTITMTVLTPSVTAVAAPSTTSCAGSNVSFTATPINGGTPSYQWKLNGNNIGGATSSSYATTALVNNDVVSVVMTPTGTCTSSMASNNLTMTILALPTITVQPVDLTKCYGSDATFTVTATGDGLSYQWKKGASNIGGATSANYTLYGVSNPDAASYSVVVSGTCTPSVTSNTVTLALSSSNVWNGATSTDWHTASNWTCGIMPSASLDAIIPSSLTLYPVVATNATANAKNVSLATGSSLTLSATSTLNVYGNWNNAGTFYPTAGSVDFRGGLSQTITKSGTSTKENFYNLTLSNGSTVTLASTTDVDVLAGGTVLVSSGTLDVNNRNFTLKSWAPYTYGLHKVDSTARLGRVTGSITNSANFAIERYIPTPIETNGRAYSKPRYVASPVQSLAASQWADSVSIFGGTGATAFKVLAGWNPLQSTLQSYYEPSSVGNVNTRFRAIVDKNTIMNVGQGYSLTVGFDGNIAYSKYGFARSYVVMKSKGIPTVGDFSQPLLKSGVDPYGWNLVGNPYPGEIDWDLVWAANSSVIASTVSQFDPQGGTTSGAYYYYNARTGRSIDPRYNIDSVGYLTTSRLNRSMIASSQGFFVFARNQGNSSMLFKEAHKPSATPKVVGNYRVGDAIATVNIGVSNGSVHDNTLVYLDKSANTYGFDADLDAFKSANTSLSISTNSFGRDLAMNGVSPENGVNVPVAVTASAKGAYRLAVRLEDADLVGTRLYLKDAFSGTLTELNAGTQTFPFEVAANNTTTKRFSIVSGASNGITTGTDGNYSTDMEVKIYPNPVSGDKLTLQLPKGNGSSRQVEITDLNGVMVYRVDIQAIASSYVIQGLPEILTAGVYTVRVVGEEGVKQQKFIYLK